MLIQCLVAIVALGLLTGCASSATIARPTTAQATSGDRETAGTEPAQSGPAQTSAIDVRSGEFGDLGWPLSLNGAVVPNPDPTPLDIDPEVRIGRLDNGLTYYLRSNAAPGDSVSLRLAVNAGSLQQEDPESGLAHFVEHMMFNGTAAYPGHTLDRTLQQIGAEIGPDFNAFTSQDETVYSLQLPSNRWDHVEIGLGILYEWASQATIETDEVIAERGVVREEVRLRDEGPDAVINARFDEAYDGASAYEDTEPGGTGEQVLATTAADARRFYDRWYRPDNMAIVAVGDVSIDDLEREIIERFSAMQSRGDSQRREPIELGPISQVLVDVLVADDFGSSFISIDWVLPAWNPGTVGGQRLTMLEDLIGSMLQARLSEAAISGQLELFDPFVGPVGLNRERSILGVNAGSPDLRAGTQAVLAEFVRAGTGGFDQAELDRAIDVWRSSIDQFAASADTLQDSFYADSYYLHFLAGADIDSVESSVDRLDQELDAVTLDDVDGHFAWIMNTAAPLVILVSDDTDTAPTVDEVATAMSESIERGMASADDSNGSSVIDVDTLVDAGEPVDYLDRREIRTTEYPTTELFFANGARVIFSDSGIEAGKVVMGARAEGGWSTLEPSDAALVPIAVDAVSRSGLGTIDALSLDRYLSTSQAFVDPFITETEEGFVGGSSSADIEAMFQLLHLYVTAPAVDGPALAQAKEDGRDAIRDVERDASSALTNAIDQLRFGDDVWHRRVPTSEELEALDAETALDYFESRLGQVDDLVIAIVGDIDDSELIKLSEQYIGTLPAGEVDTYNDVSPPPPLGVVTEQLEFGTPQSAGAVAMLYWAPLDLSGRLRVEIDLLDQIVNTRLFDTIREELSATYGGWMRISPVRSPDEGVESQVVVQGDPERLDEIRDAVLAELDDLRTNGPTTDEFDRAVSVLDSDYGFVSNTEILQQLFAAARDEDSVLSALDQSDVLYEVSARDIRELAQALFPADQRIEVIRRPGR